MATPVASSSRLPGYSSAGPADVISRVSSLSELHPDPTHPAHKALLGDLDLTIDSTRLWANSQGGITVCPEQVTQGQAGDESWAREAGYFLIVSTSRRRIDRITVSVVARSSLAFPQDRGRREDDEIFKREATFQDEGGQGVWLQQGINAFAFVLHLPPTMCISVNDPGARVSQFVVATAVGSRRGFFGRDLSSEEKVHILSIPSNLEDLIFSHHSLDYHAELGPCSLAASSSLFTVAGAILFTLDLASPPPSLRIFAFKACINFAHDVTSFRDPNKKTTLRKKVMLLEKGYEGPYTNKAVAQLHDEGREAQVLVFDASTIEGGGFAFEDMARIPPDYQILSDTRFLRPSTYAETKTCVRTSSELVVELYFTTAAAPDSTTRSNLRIAQILKKPVFLYSCGSVPGRTSLPDYVPTPEFSGHIFTKGFPCQCNESDETIFAAEWKHVRAWRAAAAAGEGTHQQETATALGRKVGELG